MVDQFVWLVVIETLEPLCSLWMLVTASARIEQLECRNRGVGVRADRWRSWKVNTWALIIVFHYSFGIYSLYSCSTMIKRMTVEHRLFHIYCSYISILMDHRIKYSMYEKT